MFFCVHQPENALPTPTYSPMNPGNNLIHGIACVALMIQINFKGVKNTPLLYEYLPHKRSSLTLMNVSLSL